MNKSNIKKAWAFGFVLILLAGFSVAKQPWKNFETNILMFLPSSGSNPNQDILTKFDQSQRNLSSFLLCSADFAKVKVAAELSLASLSESDLFASVTGKIQGDYLKQMETFYQGFPAIGVANNFGRTPQKLISRQQGLLMQVGASLRQFKTDPFLLKEAFPDYSKLKFGSFLPREDWLSLDSKNESCIFISASNKSDALDAKYQEEFLTFYDSWQKKLYEKTPEVRLIALSLVRFAGLSKSKIQGDLAAITLVSLAGIFLLLKIVFPGFRSIGAAHIALISGGIFGFSATLLIYEKIHLIALALGATLTGVAIDYVFHYVTERYFTKDQDSIATLKEVMPGINLGLVTSIIGYSGFFFAPIAGIQQTAVFAIFGLIGAWLSLQVFFPLFFQAAPTQPNPKILPFFKSTLNFWSRYGLVGSFLVFVASGLFLATGLPPVNDDIRALNSLPQELQAEAKFFVETSKIPDINRFLLVTADEPEMLLQRLEALTLKLDLLQKQGGLVGYITASSLIPSKLKQKSKLKEIQKSILGNQKELAAYLLSMGFTKADTKSYFNSFKKEPNFLDLDEWLKSPVSVPWRNMWYHSETKIKGESLSKSKAKFATVVYLSAGFDDSIFVGVESDGVTLVDRAGMISESFSQHRHSILLVLLAAYSLIFYFLWVNEGLANAFWIILPPFVGAVNVLAFLKLFGLEINLFHMLAMILILGIGIDYSIFYFHCKSGTSHKVTIAVFTSLLTTLLSFGALGLSGVAALQTLGSSLVIGLVSAFLVSSIADTNNRSALPKLPKIFVFIDTNVRRVHNVIFCGLAFVIFALCGAVIIYLIYPFVAIVTRDKILRRIRLQGIVSTGFMLYYIYLNNLGLIKGEILGLKNLEAEDKVIYVANHPSLLDFVLVASALPKVVCMVKAGVWNNPFLS
ncbi:MAG: hypothetical protein QNL04_02500, partial [SAR324 cluster bacterium]|nr:hypothetical protein [SAR324 cluster bacterium]